MLGAASDLAVRCRQAALVLLTAYAALVLAVAAGWLRPLDVPLTRAAYLESPCWALSAGRAASVLLAGELSLVYVGALALLCARYRRLAAGLGLIALLFATVAVELAFKHSFDQPAPSQILAGLDRPDCRPVSYPFISVPTPSSLPSGYAIRTAYFGLLLAALIGARWPSLAAFAWVALGAVTLILAATRVVVGWHWPSDALAGLLLGAAAAALALALADGFTWLRPVSRRARAPDASSDAA